MLSSVSLFFCHPVSRFRRQSTRRSQKTDKCCGCKGLQIISSTASRFFTTYRGCCYRLAGTAVSAVASGINRYHYHRPARRVRCPRSGMLLRGAARSAAAQADNGAPKGLSYQQKTQSKNDESGDSQPKTEAQHELALAKIDSVTSPRETISRRRFDMEQVVSIWLWLIGPCGRLWALVSVVVVTLWARAAMDAPPLRTRAFG